MSGEKYPTLSSSLQTYALLINHVSGALEDLEVCNNPTLKGAFEDCKEKLLKWFDRSSYESDYYYFATGQSVIFPKPSLYYNTNYILVLDPQFKEHTFKYFPDLFSTQYVEDCKRSLLAELWGI